MPKDDPAGTWGIGPAHSTCCSSIVKGPLASWLTAHPYVRQTNSLLLSHPNSILLLNPSLTSSQTLYYLTETEQILCFNTKSHGCV